MTALSKQDAQNLIDNAKNQILSGTASRQDIQTVVVNSRDRVISYLHDFLLQNQQQFLRQLDSRNKQYRERLAAMESQIVLLEQELRATRQQMERAAADKPQQVIVPVAQEQVDAVQEQYGYNSVQ